MESETSSMTDIMLSSELDELYHLLRKIAVRDSIHMKEAVASITRHLTTTGGSYPDLLKWLRYYGNAFLMDRLQNMLLSSYPMITNKWRRIVEVGSGPHGWLSAGLSKNYKLPRLTVDKRHEFFPDLVLDMETQPDRSALLDKLMPGDLLVFSEFIHCLNEPSEALLPFKAWPWLVLEYMATNPDYQNSYDRQIRRYGGKPVTKHVVEKLFQNRSYLQLHAFPYMFWLVEGE